MTEDPTQARTVYSRGGDAGLVARFDGRSYVALTLWNARRRACHRATGLGHELGYRLTGVALAAVRSSADTRCWASGRYSWSASSPVSL